MTDAPAKRGSMQSLKGHFLLAMPGMEDPRFARSVILMCSHDSEQAMGFVLNHPISRPLFSDILREMGLKEESERIASRDRQPPVYRGGPVEQGRGFVLHSLDYGIPTTTRLGDLAGITATAEILRAIEGGTGPRKALMVLGYAGWGAGQLENEIAQNGWLTMPGTRELIFDTPANTLYSAALGAMGVSEALLSGDAGHA